MNKLCVITGGIPGSGKTSNLDRVYPTRGLFQISADLFRAEIPATVPGPERHAAATVLARRMWEQCVLSGTSLFIESTLREWVNNYGQLQTVRRRGYTIHLVFFDCDPEVAALRIKDREFVPSIEALTLWHRESLKNAKHLIRERLIDWWVFYETSGENPVLIPTALGPGANALIQFGR